MSNQNNGDDREEEVRNRAYAIWESEGKPEGKHIDNWERAIRDMDRKKETPQSPTVAALGSSSAV